MLFCNIDLLDENFALRRGQYVGVRDGRIDYIGDAAPDGDYGERYDGRHRLLLPGFFNVHSHAPMTLLRGYAENLPLQRWLNKLASKGTNTQPVSVLMMKFVTVSRGRSLSLKMAI